MKFRLSKAVQDYWFISKGEGVTTEYAINALTKHLSYMNPERPLAKHMADLLDSIIHNLPPGSRSNHASKSGKAGKAGKHKHKSSIVSFPKET